MFILLLIIANSFKSVLLLSSAPPSITSHQAVILLDWILIGAPGGARLALEVDPLILFVDWSGFGPVELQELQT